MRTRTAASTRSTRRVKTRLFVAGTAAVLTAAVLTLGGAFRSGGAAAAPDRLPAGVAEELQRGFAAGDTQAEIAGLQGELRLRPRDVKALETLGLAYLQRVRETGDASYYPKADGVLHDALAVEPRDLIATAGLGQLALARHQFRRALALGLRARSISPTTAGVYGVIGDAEIELGHYPQAFAAFDRMTALKPSVASYARVSYARELLGDTAGAARAMELASSAAVGAHEAYAWTRVQLGLLQLSTGQAVAAARSMRVALASFDGYPFALDGLAQAEAALGHLRRARALEAQAVARVPLPQYVALLGDLEAALGEAEDFDTLVGVSATAWDNLGIGAGGPVWRRAAASFAALARQTAATNTKQEALADDLEAATEQLRTEALITEEPIRARVQVMNFHQTKGREADGVILIYREAGFVTRWDAREPFAEASRVLYVALTRARSHVTVVLPPVPHALIAPFART